MTVTLDAPAAAAPGLPDGWRLVRLAGDCEVRALAAFLTEHGDRRITGRTLEFYRTGPLGDLAAVAAVSPDGHVGAVASAWCGTTPASHTVTVTRPDLRNQGLGTAVLAASVALVRARGVSYRAEVAEDNYPSLAMAAKVLRHTTRRRRFRARGPFYAYVFWRNHHDDGIPLAPAATTAG